MSAAGAAAPSGVVTFLFTDTNHKRKRTLAGVLLSAGVAYAVPSASTTPASALPGGPVPLSAWPGCPDNPSGPCHWCPGDPPGDIVIKTCG